MSDDELDNRSRPVSEKKESPEPRQKSQNKNVSFDQEQDNNTAPSSARRSQDDEDEDRVDGPTKQETKESPQKQGPVDVVKSTNTPPATSNDKGKDNTKVDDKKKELESPGTPEKKGNVENEASKSNDKEEATMTSTHSYSLNSRQKTEANTQNDKTEKEATTNDIKGDEEGITIYTTYQTDETKQREAAKAKQEEQKAKPQPKPSNPQSEGNTDDKKKSTAMQWNEDTDTIVDDDVSTAVAHEQKEDKKTIKVENLNTKKESSEKKDANSSNVKATPVKKDPANKASPQTSTPRQGGDSSQSKAQTQDKPHLVTSYRKPAPSTSPERKPATQTKTSSNETNETQKHANRRQVSQSARYPARNNTTSRASTASRATSGKSRSIPSRPRTTLGFSTERRREREFFHAELQRLKDNLRKESKKIKKPPVRDNYPDVFNSLEPYYNTYTANYLIKMPDLGYESQSAPSTPKSQTHPEPELDEADLDYTTRKTAIGLCDPWKSLQMDNNVLPRLETAENRRRRIVQMHANDSSKPKSAGSSRHGSEPTSTREKRPEAKQGSTRLPKFPVINPPTNSDIASKELVYSDVPMLRDEMVKSFSHFGEGRRKIDYKRTRQDFFRMELDRLDDYHQNSRPHMRAAYFAYLQNTPGSKKAIYDCMKEVLGKKEKKEPTPQAVA